MKPAASDRSAAARPPAERTEKSSLLAAAQNRKADEAAPTAAALAAASCRAHAFHSSCSVKHEHDRYTRMHMHLLCQLGLAIPCQKTPAVPHVEVEFLLIRRAVAVGGMLQPLPTAHVS